MKTVNVGIIGGSGYAGGELLRLLLSHPKVCVSQVTSRKFVGQKISSVHPNLRAQTDLVFSDLEDLVPVDVLFTALPNTQSMKLIPKIRDKATVLIDLAADYRLNSAKTFEAWYQTPHLDPQHIGQSVYGLVELNRDQIQSCDFISCGGCEASSIILALYPLIECSLISTANIIADVKIASSAVGSHPSTSSHHPERQGVLRSYKPTHHRHQAEIKDQLGIDVQISATAVNLVRGILSTIHTRIKPGFGEKDIWNAYRQVYRDEPFIRIVKQKTGLYRYPEPKLLWGTNFCDVGFELDASTRRLVVLCAIDNLVKGTAGQAVQAMNARLSFSEETGLSFTGLHPI